MVGVVAVRAPHGFDTGPVLLKACLLDDPSDCNHIRLRRVPVPVVDVEA